MNFQRRQFLRQSACGFGGLALAGMLKGNPLAPRLTPFAPRAKRVIFIWMQGGPSQVDTFDPKPRLARDNGKMVDFYVPRTREVTPRKVMASPWESKQYGQSGRWVSELFPHIARHVDDLCFIHSMQTEGVAHGPASLFLHTGATNLIRPSMGAWVNYGLGTENDSLPGFVTVSPPPTKGGPRNYSNAFLPAVYQGTALGRAGQPAREARFKNVTNRHASAAAQRKQFDFLQALNREQAAADVAFDAMIDSYKLHMHDLHATVLNLLGLDHETLTYRHAGRDFRLTDVSGSVIDGVLA